MSAFVNALRSGRVLLMDGAMGTQLQRAGSGDGECHEAWNLTRPGKVHAIHRAYVEAGAEVLLANTFQANPPALSRHHQEDNLTAIIQAGLAQARASLPREGGWVLADFGPLSTTGLKEIRPMLDACGAADGIILETFSDPAAASSFVRANQSELGSKKPMLISFTFDGKTRRTFQEATPEQCAQAARDMGAVALGVNCGRDMDVAACAEVVGRYRAVCAVPLFARVNAGTPTDTKDYPHSPEAMAARLPLLLEAGAVMVGGCCGTTPRHIEVFRVVIGEWNEEG